MKAVQVAKAGGPLEIVEREIPSPPRDWVRIKVMRLRHLSQRRHAERGSVAGS